MLNRLSKWKESIQSFLRTKGSLSSYYVRSFLVLFSGLICVAIYQNCIKTSINGDGVNAFSRETIMKMHVKTICASLRLEGHNVNLKASKKLSVVVLDDSKNAKEVCRIEAQEDKIKGDILTGGGGAGAANTNEASNTPNASTPTPAATTATSTATIGNSEKFIDLTSCNLEVGPSYTLRLESGDYIFETETYERIGVNLILMKTNAFSDQDSSKKGFSFVSPTFHLYNKSTEHGESAIAVNGEFYVVADENEVNGKCDISFPSKTGSNFKLSPKLSFPSGKVPTGSIAKGTNLSFLMSLQNEGLEISTAGTYRLEWSPFNYDSTTNWSATFPDAEPSLNLSGEFQALIPTSIPLSQANEVPPYYKMLLGATYQVISSITPKTSGAFLYRFCVNYNDGVHLNNQDKCSEPLGPIGIN